MTDKAYLESLFQQAEIFIETNAASEKIQNIPELNNLYSDLQGNAQHHTINTINDLVEGINDEVLDNPKVQERVKTLANAARGDYDQIDPLLSDLARWSRISNDLDILTESEIESFVEVLSILDGFDETTAEQNLARIIDDVKNSRSRTCPA